MHAPAVFDADLVRRYDRRGPRYTSYPTALQFHTNFDIAAYRRAALLSNAAPAKPLSIYVHAPFCVSPCFYCGCNRIITRDAQQGVDYLQRLNIEIELQSALFDRNRIVRQLHLGGGTPTFFTSGQLASVLHTLHKWFSLDSSRAREFSIEIDPRTVRPDAIAALAAMGFNRISLGVQDFDPEVQRAINRMQSIAQVEDALRQARASGFRSVSFDLIYGLPLQNLTSFARTLEQVVAMRPDRVAVYGYAHIPNNFRAQRAIDAAQLPSAEGRLQLLALTVEKLTQAGYVHIGMDHFALPEDDLCAAQAQGDLHRNFQGYSTCADCDLVGLGVSSIGSLGRAYAQNSKRLREYFDALDHGRLPVERGLLLTVDDEVRRDVIHSIMCHGAVKPRAIAERYALDFASYFAYELNELRVLQADGLLRRVDDEEISVSDRGHYLLRSIAMVFDAYLRAQAETAFSRVI